MGNVWAVANSGGSAIYGCISMKINHILQTIDILQQLLYLWNFGDNNFCSVSFFTELQDKTIFATPPFLQNRRSKNHYNDS